MLKFPKVIAITTCGTIIIITWTITNETLELCYRTIALVMVFLIYLIAIMAAGGVAGLPDFDPLNSKDILIMA